MGLQDIETIPETGAVFTIGRSRFADNVASHFFIRKDPVVTIECGDEHSAVVCQTGRLFVFGSNDWGQLGLGHKNHISKPSCVKILKPEKVTHVACGRAHTLICTGSQKLFACGSNQEGQLGRENSTIGDSSSSPILVYDCGLAGPRIVQIAAGSHHSIALTSDGGVIAWGSNLEGQLGLPGISGLVHKPTKVSIPEPVKEISAGYYHSAFLTESGLVYVCGESESGKLGIDVYFSTQVAPKQMQLPVPAIHVACGGHHTLVLAENGSIYCTGSNASGQLGLGTNVHEVLTPKLLSSGVYQDEKIVKIVCGESHSAILTESGKLYMCGDGRHGKLGLEENENNVHEVTFAAKYQELFVLNVACGGCHTILVGRRHEINYQSQQQSDSSEQSASMKSSLPPLKLPVNMQNEQRDGAENKSTKENNDSHRTDKINEKSQNDNDSQSTDLNDALKKDSNVLDKENISSTVNDKNVASPTKTLETDLANNQEDVLDTNLKREESQTSPNHPSNETSLQNKENSENKENIQNKENSENKENIQNKENSENKESVQSNDANKNNESMENKKNINQPDEESSTELEISRTRDKVEQEMSASPALSPTSSKAKSENIKDAIGNDNEIEKDEEKMTENVEQDSQSTDRRKSSILKTDIKNTIETIENTIEKFEGDGRTEESEKAETDVTQDDADVVQSPAPRTAKVTKLFKGKQQEVQNGTEKRSGTHVKSKSKTCSVL
ncbi:X-linked retinitis pigmentosa GTPase regulator-like [Pseudomyrmex gracilis]|uniref:X-linked retinitis pigmentosa GTPase regulator-like n=1 Tax=Pseudomyrmex gracilis TaxID=219809 RepID=UPI0009956F70|nr:X-linked retinitis pigmentosa GTPase regulator-like [Pseudomyrmex gracilis]